MKLSQIIPRKAILLNVKAANKKGVIQELVTALKKASPGESLSVKQLVDAVMKREKVGSTGVGSGIAIPHAKHDSIEGIIGAFGRVPGGLDFDSVDGAPVELVFLLLASPKKNDAYLKLLRGTMGAIKQPHFCNFLRKAKTAKDIVEIFKDTEDVVQV